MIGFQVKRTLKIGLKSLWLHGLRSGLTLLGIMFGVCSVIAMLAIGTGAGEEAQEQIRKLGSNNIIVQSMKPAASQDATESQDFVLQYGITYKDADRIRATIPGVEVTVGSRRLRQAVTHGSRRFETHLVGTVPWYDEVANVTVLRGRFLNALDMYGKRGVCVLGQQAAKILFPLGDAVGSIINAGDNRFEVVGIVSSFQRGEVEGQELQGDPNSEVYVPAATMQIMYGETNFTRSSGSFTAERVEVSELIVQVDELDRVRSVEIVIDHLLRMEHGDDQDYQIIVPLRLLEQARETRRIFSIVLGSIAAISLLVGGIGIMNITLATVIERTREIGIRRAMGAKRRHIIFQFLVETTLLSLIGGVLGIALGIVIPLGVERFAHMRTIVTPWSLILAFGISVAVGLIFGIYPAYRAAHMDPIQALRHE